MCHELVRCTFTEAILNLVIKVIFGPLSFDKCIAFCQLSCWHMQVQWLLPICFGFATLIIFYYYLRLSVSSVYHGLWLITIEYFITSVSIVVISPRQWTTLTVSVRNSTKSVQYSIFFTDVGAKAILLICWEYTQLETPLHYQASWSLVKMGKFTALYVFLSARKSNKLYYLIIDSTYRTATQLRILRPA